jgi:general nucleoside transport system ATP-binding protein
VGLDVGSIEYIHGRILQKRDEGCAVLVVSSELDEIMELSDRIAVMYRGKIVDILTTEEATKEKVGLLMAGVKPEAHQAALA